MGALELPVTNYWKRRPIVSGESNVMHPWDTEVRNEEIPTGPIRRAGVGWERFHGN